MITLSELNKEYKKMKGEDIACIILYIHMPTGEEEVIVNSNVDEKIKYINKTYNEDLIHNNCKDIYITEFMFGLNEEYVNLTFGEALEEVKKGKGMRLPNWSKDVVIRAQFPDKHSKMTAPYLYVESRFGRVPWKETMIELFSEEWEVVE